MVLLKQNSFYVSVTSLSDIWGSSVWMTYCVILFHLTGRYLMIAVIAYRAGTVIVTSIVSKHGSHIHTGIKFDYSLSLHKFLHAWSKGYRPSHVWGNSWGAMKAGLFSFINEHLGLFLSFHQNKYFSAFHEWISPNLFLLLEACVVENM